MNQRELALDILYKTISDDGFTNLLMREELKKVPPIQRPFINELVMGVLRNYDLLLYQVKDDLNEKTKAKLRIILAMAMYERFFMHEKDYVVNNEYVNLAFNKYEKSYVNALLHKTKEFKKPVEDHLLYSIPEWMSKLLKSQYSQEDYQNILKTFNRKNRTYYRINHKKCKKFELLKYDVEFLNDDIFVSENNLIDTLEFKKGYFYVQDINSSGLYKLLDLKKGMSLFDVCSAPGSKLFNCLDILNPEDCVANDLHKHRVELISLTSKKLGFGSVTCINEDATKVTFDRQFDRIWLDAPCSGIGVIGRRPDIKFHVTPRSLDELQSLQGEILGNVSKYLKSNCVLLYSTCTLNKKENEKQISKFLNTHPEFECVLQDTIIKDEGDCFYYAKLIKKDICA